MIFLKTVLECFFLKKKIRKKIEDSKIIFPKTVIKIDFLRRFSNNRLRIFLKKIKMIKL